MAQSMTNFDAALKDNYGPGLKNAVNGSNPILTEIRHNSEDIIGRKAVWAVHTGRSASTGARAESGTLPTADRQRYSQLEEELVFNYHTVKVTGQAKHLTRGDQGAFARALESELDGAEKDIRNDRARQLFGQALTDGTALQSGVLGIQSGDPGTGTTVTFTAATTASEMRYFFIGMQISYIDPSTGAVRAGGPYEVTAVSVANKTLTVGSAINAAAAASDYVVRYGNFGAEINGLRHLINATSVFAGVNPATVPTWGAAAAGSSTTPISEVLFETADEAVQTDGDGSSPNLFIAEHSQVRKLSSVLQAQKRYDAAQTTLPSGWKGLAVAQGTLLKDRYCPVNDIFGISTADLERFVGLDWTWDEDDGKVLYKALDGSDAVEARFKVYDQMVVTNRNSHVRITVATPTF